MSSGIFHVRCTDNSAYQVPKGTTCEVSCRKNWIGTAETWKCTGANSQAPKAPKDRWELVSGQLECANGNICFLSVEYFPGKADNPPF